MGGVPSSATIIAPRSSEPGRGKEGAEGALDGEMGSDSYIESRGFLGEESLELCFESRMELTGSRCHSPKIEMVPVHIGISVRIRKRHPFYLFTPIFQEIVLTLENLPCLRHEQ